MTKPISYALAGCLTLVLGLTPGLAQPSDEDVLAQLGNESYAVRQAATERLLVDPTLGLDTLAQWSSRELSPEQQHRLLRVARHHTLRQMRLAEFPAEGPGSIGVVQSAQTQPEGGDPALHRGVMITQVLPGFPGEGRLRVGDRIVAINGVAIEEGPAKGELFQARMRRFFAGQVIGLSVLRNGETLEVAVPLVNGAALPQMYPPQQFKLAPRFAEGWQQERQGRFAALAPHLLETPP